MAEEKYSISETARLLGVHRGTLRRWIKARAIPEPVAEDIAGSRLRYWTATGLAKVKQYKEEHFRDGQGLRSKRVKKAK
jgi:predicted site-specific integrase-resolvase